MTNVKSQLVQDHHIHVNTVAHVRWKRMEVILFALALKDTMEGTVRTLLVIPVSFDLRTVHVRIPVSETKGGLTGIFGLLDQLV